MIDLKLKRYKKQHRKHGEISLACHLMREGLLDVCLECGQVYTFFKGKRKKKLRQHYKDYLYVDLEIVDNRPRRRKRKYKNGRVKKWRMSAWVHRLAYMKIKAIKDFIKARKNDEIDNTHSWRTFVFDLPPSLDIDHKNKKRTNNTKKNLIIRTHTGNSSRKKISKQEQDQIEKEFNEFMNS